MIYYTVKTNICKNYFQSKKEDEIYYCFVSELQQE